MQGVRRKIVQAVLYELVAVVLVGPVMALLYQQSLAYSLGLSVVISLVAMGWNMVFNSLFEWWERQRAGGQRTLFRRMLHSVGFEGGLVLWLVPLVSWWLGITLWQALWLDVGLFAFFFVYSLVFHWAFDRVFGLPSSAG